MEWGAEYGGVGGTGIVERARGVRDLEQSRAWGAKMGGNKDANE